MTGPCEWTFESTITDPAGIRVSVEIAVPAGLSWNRTTQDASEIGQIAAVRAARMIDEHRKMPPF